MAKKKKGYWRVDGYIWKPGEIPKCTYCEKSVSDKNPIHSTPVSDIFVCEKTECVMLFMMDECPVLTFKEK